MAKLSDVVVIRLFDKRFCYHLDKTDFIGCDCCEIKYRVAVVFEGESGYRVSNEPEYWTQSKCDDQNASLGLSEDDVHNLLIQSMFPGAKV